MSQSNHLDKIRRKVLDDVEQSQKRFQWAIAGAAIFEGAGYVAYFLLADWSNRLHVLLFVAVLMVNTTIVIGLVVSGAHLNLSMQRVLKAVELMDDDEESENGRS